MTTLLPADVRRFAPPADVAVRGTVYLLPGRGEHAGVYERFGRRLAADGYLTIAVDEPASVARPPSDADRAALVGPVVLVGSDTGALWAIAIAASAARDPGARLPVDGIVLNDASHRTVAAHIVQWLERLRGGSALTVERTPGGRGHDHRDHPRPVPRPAAPPRGRRGGGHRAGRAPGRVHRHLVHVGVAAAAWRPGPYGVPLLDGVHAVLVCRIADRLPAGDHTIVLAEPVDGRFGPDASRPLVYHDGRYTRAA